MRILRVFPRRTAMTPDDELAFVGDPPLPGFRPAREAVDEVHVSCTFAADVAEAARLYLAWADHYEKVHLGGPAIGSRRPGAFIPGRYLRDGVTITSRGCPNRCPWCLVPRREGGIRELRDVAPGHEIQDNNLLACYRSHFLDVCEMLRAQKRAAVFSGGLDPRRLSPWHIEQLRGLRIRQLFLSYDSPEAEKPVERAIQRLQAAGLTRRKLRCYVLCGWGDDTPRAAEARCRWIWNLGAMPFAMLWRGDGEKTYSASWRRLQKRWTRPAIMFARADEELVG